MDFGVNWKQNWRKEGNCRFESRKEVERQDFR